MKPSHILIAVLAMTASTGVPGELTDSKQEAAEALLVKNDISAADLRITQYVPYKAGGGIVKALQVHEGLPVFDGEITYHFGEGGKIVTMPTGAAFSMGGRQDLSQFEVNTDDLVTEEEAWQAIVEEHDRLMVQGNSDYARSAAVDVHNCAERSKSEAELGIVEKKIVWRFKCTYKPLPVVFVDATDGSLVEIEPPAFVPPPIPKR
jgi:Zn-dependent metalloprotease